MDTWTAAINAIVKDYNLLLEISEEIYTDKYGLKATGLLQSLEKFNTLFGIKLHLIKLINRGSSYFGTFK